MRIFIFQSIYKNVTLFGLVKIIESNEKINLIYYIRYRKKYQKVYNENIKLDKFIKI